MLPAGDITRAAIAELGALASPGDIIIDGGNSFWKDDLAHAKTLGERGVHYVDVGVSGGVWGLERGYCLMIGGDQHIVDKLEPIFRTLAPGAGDAARTQGKTGPLSSAEQGYVHVGPNGAGHFVKMVHNGIEYGLMQAYAEGFGILRHAASGAAAPSFRPGCSMSPRWRWRATTSLPAIPALSPIPAKRAGPSTPRSTRRRPRTSSPRPSCEGIEESPR
jgi:6-phosphogluconate dehydrogenase